MTLLLCVALLGASGEGLRRYTLRYMAPESREISAELRLGEEVRKKTEPNALVIAVNKSNPSMLYNAHRKGWNASPSEAVDERFLAPRIALGAEYLIGIHEYFTEESDKRGVEQLLHSKKYEVIHNDDQAFIVKLSSNLSNK